MQIETLWRYAAEPILCFDGDAAGGRAAARAAERALPRLHSGFSLRFATLPAGEDPDSLIVHQGKPALDAVLAAAEPLSAVLWRIASGTTGLDTPEGRAAVNRRLQGYLEQIAERDLRFYYQQHYRERLTARPRQRPLRGRQPPPTFRSGAAMQTFQEDRLPALHTLPSQTDSAAGPRARTILQTLYNFPLLLGEFAEELAEIEFASGPHRAVRDFLIAAVRGGALDHGDLEARLRDAGLDQVAAELIGDRARYLDWAARAGPAALDEARIQLRQVIDLYRRLRDLENFRREAEAALAREASQENLDRLIGALEAINAAPGTEVALPGYADQPRNSRVED
jgi:DNA primase